MKKQIILFYLIILQCTSLIAYNGIEILKFEQTNENQSILIFIGETRHTVLFDENKNPKSNIVNDKSYHIINLKTKNVTFLYKRKGKNEWYNQSIDFNSIIEKEGVYQIQTNSEICEKIYFENSELSTLTYSFKDDLIISYENLKIITKQDFDKLKIYDWKQAKIDKREKSKSTKGEIIKNFEYSEYWRKQAFVQSINFIKKNLLKQEPKCKMVKRTSYNPSNVNYIGNQGMNVKFYAKYDCNQNYINTAYFIVNAYYFGNEKWVFELEDHKLTH